MSATIITDPTPEPAHQPVQTGPNLTGAETDDDVDDPKPVKCDCCGLTEECTQSYINAIRERYMGKWICGLCAEAVKYEVVRTERLITTEEAVLRHTNMCNTFKQSSSPPPDPTVRLISAMRQILRRSLDSPRRPRSTPGSPSKDDDGSPPPILPRTGSCFASLTTDS